MGAAIGTTWHSMGDGSPLPESIPNCAGRDEEGRLSGDLGCGPGVAAKLKPA